MIVLARPPIGRSFLVLLIVLAIGMATILAIDEVVDDYENENRVSVKYQVIRNSTLDVMELNFTSGGGSKVLENFTDYTTVDTNNKITVNESMISFVNLRRDDAGYVVEDYGVDFWDDFVAEFTVVINDTESGDADQRWIGFIFTMNNYVGVFNSRPAGHDSLFVSVRDDGATDNSYKFSISGYENAILIGEDIGNIRAVSNTELYLRLNRTDDDLILQIYTDSTYTTLDETLSLLNMGLTEALRYDYGLQSLDIVNDGNIWMSGYVEDLWLGNLTTGGYLTDGYFNTTNFLTGLSYNATVLLTNTSIPSGSINAEISSDGSTWTDLGGLGAGYDSLDLRALGLTDAIMRFNFTRGVITDTPRLYQVRLVHEGPGLGGPGQNVTGEWIDYRASAINFTVGTHAGGDLNSTFDIDGNTWNHTEVVGVPGSVISVNFTGVDPDAECIWVTIWYLYDGNLNHDFDIEMWNFTSSAWVDDGHLIDGVAFTWANSTIYAMRIPLDFLSGGEVRVRLNHESAGNINHDLFIDYIRLIAKVPGDPLVVTAGLVDETPWLAIGLILALSMFLLADRLRR